MAEIEQGCEKWITEEATHFPFSAIPVQLYCQGNAAVPYSR